MVAAFGGIHQRQKYLAVDFANGIRFHALGVFTAGAGGKVELVGVERADNPAVADEAFGEWALPVRATVLDSKPPTIALAEDGDLLAVHHETAALANWNLFDAAEIDDAHRFNHCTPRPPARGPTPDP